MTGSSPSAITDEKRTLLIDAFKEGATQKIACGIAKVAPRTFQRWAARGLDDLNEWADECDTLAEAGDPDPAWPTLTVYAAFYLDVAEAIGTRELDWLKALKSVTSKEDGQWQRFAWLLERTNPGEFALKDRVVDQAGNAGAAKIEDRSASLADVARVLEAVGALAQLGRGADRAEVPADRPLLPAPRDP